MAAPAHSHGSPESDRRRALVRLLYLSIGAALLTILLKAGAFVLTGSVGLLSDAAESLVNLVAAIVALLVVRYASRPPDEDHPHGHDKADYFSAGFEGGLIVLAAGSIAVTAILRLFDPQPIDSVGIGVAVSLVASVVNLFMARALIRAGREHGSVVLEADGEHLRADVITSVGVVLGLGAVVATGWQWLDPVIALVVAVNILVTGAQLLRRSASGLMDAALESQTLAEIEAVLNELRSPQLEFHALRTRRAGRRAFVSVHVLVPGDWSVQRGHDLAEEVEARLRAVAGYGASVLTHLEPLDDPRSHEDVELDRERPA